jgi:hypothetical protein
MRDPGERAVQEGLRIAGRSLWKGGTEAGR